MNKPTKRIVYVDMLRSLAIVGVVAIHSFDPFIQNAPSWNHSTQMLLLACTSLFRFAVPLYVVISGALLLSGPIEPFGRFMSKRLLRLALPIAVWSVLFGVWGAFSEAHFSWYDYLFRVIIFGQPFYLLFVLLGLYCITPIIKKWVRSTTTKEQAIVVFGTLVLASCVTLVENWLLAGNNILPHFSFNYFLYYVGYYIAGYLLHTAIISQKNLPLIIGFFGSAASVALLTIMLVSRFGSVPKSFIWYDYLSLPVICMTICLFMLVKKQYVKNLTLVTAISKASLGMYFIHMVIIPFIKPVVAPFMSVPLLYCCIIFLIAFFGSFGMTMIVSKIPRLNQLLGCTS